jgi:hypothetical protein
MFHSFRDLVRAWTARWTPSTNLLAPAPAAKRPAKLAIEQLEARAIPSGTPWLTAASSTPQSADDALFRTELPGLQAHLQADGDAVLVAGSATGTAQQAPPALRLDFLKTNANPQIVGLGAGKGNFFALNKDSASAAGFAKVIVRDLYDGIDLVYRQTPHNHLEFVFRVHPGADPSDIKLAYRGAERLRLDSQNNLHVRLPGAHLVEKAPVAFQTIAGRRQEVPVRPGLDANGRLHFGLGAYDRSRLLVIDPEINNPPTANGESYSVYHDQPLYGTSVLANDTDPESDPLTATLVSTTSHGSLTFGVGGNFTYEPDLHYVGSDSFTYKAYDGTSYSNVATVTIDVTNTAPVAQDKSYSTVHDQTFYGMSVLAGDTDAESDSLTASLVNGVSHGSLTFDPDGSFDYTPVAGYVGSDSFSYRAFDGIVYSNLATVTIEVTNTAPLAQDETYSGVHDQELYGMTVLGNDSDAESDPLTASLASGVSNGSLTFNPDGSFTYNPNPGFVGIDRFSYRAFDGIAYSNTAIVTLNVTNEPPEAVDDSYSVPKDHLLTVDAASGVLSNDSDPDSDPLTASLESGPSHGFLTLNADGSFNYAPTSGYVGADSFTYLAFDGIDYSNSATVTINVIDLPPPEGTQISVSDVEVMEGNSDTTEAVFWISLSQAESATVTVNYATADGTATLYDNDYLSASGTLIFEPGTTSLPVLVSVVGDPWIEDNEVFALYLSNPSGYAAIADGIGTGTILDDEPVVSLFAADPDAAEEGSNPGAFTVARTGNTSTDLVVYYEITGSAGNGVDYASLSGSALIPAGQSSAPIDISPINDASAEGAETAHILLTSGAGYRLGAVVSDLVWIADSDGPVAGPNLDLIAFRPRTPPFQRTPVPAATEDTVGAGIRSNGDDDDGDSVRDWDDAQVAAENDLIEISLDFGLQQVPQGISYFLRRSNANVRVWDSNTKGGSVLNANNEQEIPFAPGLSLWVEWVNATFGTADAVLTFEARDAATQAVVGVPDSVRVFRFTSVVIVIGGRLQVPTDPPNANQGVFVIGRQLYATEAYDVHMFREGVQVAGGANRGRGAAYTEVVNAVNNRGVTSVSVFGYSWGGGATYNLIDRLVIDAAAGLIQHPFAIPYTAYIDAVLHGIFNFGNPETRRPPASQFHVNYYERIGTPGEQLNVMGDAVPGSDFELNVNTTLWGSLLNSSLPHRQHHAALALR